jgi:hypothetical protein
LRFFSPQHSDHNEHDSTPLTIHRNTTPIKSFHNTVTYDDSDFDNVDDVTTMAENKPSSDNDCYLSNAALQHQPQFPYQHLTDHRATFSLYASLVPKHP